MTGRQASVWLALGVALSCAACLHDRLVACEDGRVCPVGTVCTATSCASQEDTVPCVGVIEGGACSSPNLAAGTCVGGACTLPGCGNGGIDLGSSETCDDGNTVSGDGCTSTCAMEACGNGEQDLGERCDDGNVITGDGCSATCQSEEPRWTRLDPYVDDERKDMAAAYLPMRGRVVRFGGSDLYDGIRNGTYELVDDHWVRIATNHAPSARKSAAAAYDSARKRWVLFGGKSYTSSGPHDLADTWEFDGTDWQQIAVSGPPAGQHVMAYDDAAQRAVLFCGATGETWSYAGTSWQRVVSATAPPTRTGAAMAHDPINHRIVLFGGNGVTTYADTWELVGNQWSAIQTTGAVPAQSWSAMAYDPSRHALIMQSRDVTWILDGSAWTPIVGTAPRQAQNAALVFDPARGRLVRYGGGGGGAVTFDDLYELFPDGWHLIGAPTPSDRTAAQVTTDTLRGRVLLFGGESWADGDLDDLWAFDGTTWTDVVTASRPPPTSHSGMAYDPGRDRVVLIARDQATWEFDGTDWRLVASATSTPRLGGPPVYDPDRARVVAVGDRYSTTVLSTYSYDGTDWQLLPVQDAPAPVRFNDGYSLAHDPDHHRVVLFDGVDTWELDATTWTRRDFTTSPPLRWGSTMTYHPLRHRMVLTSGSGADGHLNDTWEYDGSEWRQLPTDSSYTGRDIPAQAWLPSAASVVMFGGNDYNTTHDDTWLLGWQTP